MRISKMIKVEDGVKLNYFQRRRIVDKNTCIQTVYLVCTSPCSNWLFEIIYSEDLSSRYNESYLVAVAKTRKQAVLQVEDLIDRIYNKKELKYEQLII